MSFAQTVDLKSLRSSTRDHKKSTNPQTQAGTDPIRALAVASHPLFTGTMYLANLQFRRKDQAGAITAFSNSDIANVLEYMTLACPVILRYTSQYGQAAAAISIADPERHSGC